MSTTEWRQKQRARRLGTCVHFTGIMNDKCEKGVAYRDVRNEDCRPHRFPCTGDSDTTCHFKQLPTETAVDAEDAESARRLAFYGTARALIVAEKKPNGAINCPACGAENGLGFTVSAYNGHVHASCQTKDCLSWME